MKTRDPDDDQNSRGTRHRALLIEVGWYRPVDQSVINPQRSLQGIISYSRSSCNVICFSLTCLSSWVITWQTWAGVVPHTQQLSPCMALVCNLVLSEKALDLELGRLDAGILGGGIKRRSLSGSAMALSQFNCVNMEWNDHVQFRVYKLSIGLEKDQTEGARLRLYFTTY